MANHRQERVEAVITQTISSMLVMGAIKDPRVDSSVSVSGVILAKDLSWAKISIAGFIDEAKLHKAVAGLNSAAGFIQSQLAKNLQTRLTPKLSFQADFNVKAAFEMTKKIEELINDKPESGDATPQ